MPSRRALVLLLGMTVLFGAACSSDASSSPTSTPESATANAATPDAAAPDAATPDAATPAPGGEADGAAVSEGDCRAASSVTNLSFHGSAAADSAADIDAGDQFFEATCVTVQPGVVALTVENVGQALHNIKVADQGIDEDIRPGERITVQVQVDSSPVAFVCKYHVTLGMAGALVPAS